MYSETPCKRSSKIKTAYIFVFWEALRNFIHIYVILRIILPFFFPVPSLNWLNCKISVLFWHYRIRKNYFVSIVVDVFWMVHATQAVLKEYQVIGEKAGQILLVHIHTTYEIKYAESILDCHMSMPWNPLFQSSLWISKRDLFWW